MSASEAHAQERIVTVWFGSHPVARYRAFPAQAEDYAGAMDQRYPGLRITNDPASAETAQLRRMPGGRLWAPESAVA